MRSILLLSTGNNTSSASTSPRPAASVAFVRDTLEGLQVYFSRRPMHFRYFPGAFVFPGGRAEDSDHDLKHTACREVKEEIGVHITPDQLFLLRETHTAAHAGPVYHLFIYACLASSDMETLPNPDEIDEEIWMAPDAALDQLDLPYQIMLAVRAISRFSKSSDLFRALERGAPDKCAEDYGY